MSNITVYALEGCEKCKYLMKMLDTLSIQYTTHFCEEVSTICDTLENVTGWHSYPIVLIESENKKVYLNSGNAKRKSEIISEYVSLEVFPNLDRMSEYIEKIKK